MQFKDDDTRDLYHTSSTYQELFHLFQNEPGKRGPSPASKHGRPQ